MRLEPFWKIDGEIVGFGVGPDGVPLAVTTDDVRERYETGRGGARFAKTVESRGRTLRVVAPDGVRVVLENERWWFDFVQPLPGGRTLLAGARARGDRNNACVVRADGSIERRFALGDGIAEVQATASGTIYASYFDEGVFGDEQLPGLRWLTDEGTELGAYDPAAAGTDDIVDCYALNVAGDDDVWLYFYTEFSLVRLHGGRATVRRGLPRGARGIAIAGDRVALFGGYDTPSTIHRFGGESFEITDESGESFAKAGVTSRGEAVFLLHRNRVYRFRV